MVTLLTFGQFPVRAVEVVPNVVDHVPGVGANACCCKRFGHVA